ncbi:MAG: PLP-dependent aspartate aminotransferase family protein [Verrucomicrobia bacterium]|nr:PLP-dependent aspartate aminotransferase family protein [Verrucomicrobiota bacterium]
MTNKEKISERLATLCVHQGVNKDDTFNAVITPIYATSTFAFEAPGKTKGHDYSRTSNPTRSALEECLAALEGGAAASATSTGMSATATVMHLLPAGAHVIAGHDIYGGTYRLFSSILPQRGISFSFVDMGDPENVRDAIRPETKAVWIETPSNPLLNLVDIKAVCNIASENGLISMVDNTFMSPYFQRPFELGADLVIHSTTKYLNGHSDVVGGAIISKSAETGAKVAALTNALGTCCAPFDAWLVLRGVKTLPCRMKAHNENAMSLALFLDGRDEVEKVYYPGLESHPDHELAKKQMTGFGGMLSFDIKGGSDAAFKFIGELTLYAFAESLGGVESLIEHPDSMSHASMDLAARRAAGIKEGNIRVSVGIEDAADLVADMERAFAAL